MIEIKNQRLNGKVDLWAREGRDVWLLDYKVGSLKDSKKTLEGLEISAWAMKHPPTQMRDDAARQGLERWLAGLAAEGELDRLPRFRARKGPQHVPVGKAQTQLLPHAELRM